MTGAIDEASRKSSVVDPVEAILASYRIRGSWQALKATGIANRIYATADVVLRVATDHEDAVSDALTESVAAPVARDAGILTPRLIAFDDSRKLIDRPFSLWERIHGEALGSQDSSIESRERTWHQTGRQIALLHGRVKVCPDPEGYLDTPERGMRWDALLQQLADSRPGSRAFLSEIERMISELIPVVSSAGRRCFLHNDLHEWNILCNDEGELLAVIDWGDAGWGDPTLDFAAIPFPFVPAALNGYGDIKQLGAGSEARIVWDHLYAALDDAVDDPSREVSVPEYRHFLDRAR